jgi:hypothetical protein
LWWVLLCLFLLFPSLSLLPSLFLTITVLAETSASLSAGVIAGIVVAVLAALLILLALLLLLKKSDNLNLSSLPPEVRWWYERYYQKPNEWSMVGKYESDGRGRRETETGRREIGSAVKASEFLIFNF